MRLERWKNFPQKLVYFTAAGLLLAVLILFGSSDNQANKKSVPVKVQSNQAQNADEVVSKPTEAIETSTEGSNSQDTSNGTNSTKVHVSINANTTNGETTGSTNVQVTTNGETQDFSGALDECLTVGKIRISTEDSKIRCESGDGSLEINWKSSSDQDQKNKKSFDQTVDTGN
ncbi:MAG: hypothetical protein Q8O75_02605 [bacterium]|nr:hypothetical protein [bacterium]